MKISYFFCEEDLKIIQLLDRRNGFSVRKFKIFILFTQKEITLFYILNLELKIYRFVVKNH